MSGRECLSTKSTRGRMVCWGQPACVAGAEGGEHQAVKLSIERPGMQCLPCLSPKACFCSQSNQPDKCKVLEQSSSCQLKLLGPS
jgi:hypothetical protein